MHNLLLATFVITITICQSKIIGYVYDKNTSESLAGVRIVTENDTTYTDFNGQFELLNPSRTTKLNASLISYVENDTIIKKHNKLIFNKK